MLADQTEGYENEQGRYALRERAWRGPRSIDEATRTAALQELERADRAYVERPSAETVLAWLTRLGLLTRSRSDAGDLAARLEEYTRQLVHQPAGLFTEELLSECSGHFTFFPSYAELSGFFTPHREKLRKHWDRLETLCYHTAIEERAP